MRFVRRSYAVVMGAGSTAGRTTGSSATSEAPGMSVVITTGSISSSCASRWGQAHGLGSGLRSQQGSGCTSISMQLLQLQSMMAAAWLASRSRIRMGAVAFSTLK